MIRGPLDRLRAAWRELLDLLGELVARFWASMMGGTGV